LNFWKKKFPAEKIRIFELPASANGIRNATNERGSVGI